MSAATQLASVNTALDNLTAELAAMSTASKPYYTLPGGPNGQGAVMSAVEYRRYLSDEIQKLIAIRTQLEEPWQVNRRLCRRW